MLELLDIKGCIITADAMSCQKEIVRKIADGEADYAESARNHWGVESSLHWCLDVTFREDHSRMRADHSAENFCVVRHIALNVLKSMDDKMSVARRRRHCAYDDAYLEKVIEKLVHA